MEGGLLPSREPRVPLGLKLPLFRKWVQVGFLSHVVRKADLRKEAGKSLWRQRHLRAWGTVGQAH